MARGKAATFEQQRLAILGAAALLFAQRGFHSASMAEIARACGVSKPLLYHYYRDKEHLLFDIADNYIDRLVALVEAVDAARLEALPHLEALIARFLEIYASSQSHHAVIVQDVKFLRPELRTSVRAKEGRVVAAFADAIERVEPGLRRQGLDKPVAMILFGMINWTFTWLRPDGPLSYADMAPIVSRIFIQGVSGLAGARQTTKSRATTADPIHAISKG